MNSTGQVAAGAGTPMPASGDTLKQMPLSRPSAGSGHGSFWYHKVKQHSPIEEQEKFLLASDHPDTGAGTRDTSPPPQPHTFYESRSPPTISKPHSSPISSARNRYLERDYDLGRRPSSRDVRHTLIVGIIILMSLLFVLLFGFLCPVKGHSKTSICTTAACVHAASGILYNLDPSYPQLDPCTNFDSYVCGGFRQLHDLRPDQGQMFTGTLMSENSQTILRHILEGDISKVPSVDRDNFEKLLADYEACTDEKTINSLGLEPLRAMVDEVKKSFPVSSVSAHHGMANATSKDLTETILYMTNVGISALVAIGVGADDKYPETQVIFISSSRVIGLPSKEYYENKPLVAEYQAMASQILPHFLVGDPEIEVVASEGSTQNMLADPRELGPARRAVEDLIADVIALEVKLATATPPEEDQNDITKTYNPRTVNETSALLPQISFEHLISKLAPAGYAPENVIVASPLALSEVSRLLLNTPRETLQAFLVWTTILHYASRIEDPTLKPLTQFKNKLRGLDPEAIEERWRTCVNSADNDLGWILSKFFVDNAFSAVSKEFGDQIVSDIKGSFVSILEDADWMTEDVRNRSITKVYAIDQKIGYPTSNPDIMDPDALKKYYQEVPIFNSTYFENRIQVVQFETRQEWSKLGKPTRHDEWGMTVPTVNAYYNPAGNEIVFPAGIMQHPVFYDPSVPQYLSYGAFGAVSGHELSHAFDNTGSQYDESGAYKQWWDNTTREAFEKKTACFIEQYSNFSIPGLDDKALHVNGRLTLGENVADAGGLHAAFAAWKTRENKKPSQALPGLAKFTKEQLFFINYGNWWCGKATKERAIAGIYTDPHAPMWARILGTMANSAEFKEAFNCPSKEATCGLW